jgi:hypothetical protein
MGAPFWILKEPDTPAILLDSPLPFSNRLIQDTIHYVRQYHSTNLILTVYVEYTGDEGLAWRVYCSYQVHLPYNDLPN